MNKIILFLSLILVISCKTKMNQYILTDDKHKKRHGKWREEYSADDGKLTAIGKYNKGEKVGKWKIYFGSQLYEKNKVRKDITKIKRYFPDGRLMESGQTKLDISANERHWYYFGDWKYFSKEGKLLYIKTFYRNKKADSVSYVK